MASGNVPLFLVPQRGQSLISASTRRSTVSKTMSTSTRVSCPEHAVPDRSHRRHSVTGLVSVTVTVRRLPGSVSLAFGPLPPEFSLLARRAVPSVSAREGGRPALRLVLRVVLSSRTATRRSSIANRTRNRASTSPDTLPSARSAATRALASSTSARSDAPFTVGIAPPPRP